MRFLRIPELLVWIIVKRSASCGPESRFSSAIVISDRIVPDSKMLPAVQDRFVGCFDLLRKKLFNARELDIDTWTFILQKADAKFRVLRDEETCRLVTGHY